MCLSPIRLKDRTLVACRGCSLCRDNRLNDLIGRCVAEQQTATQSLSVTLTYAGDVPNAVILYYRDVQNMLKALRNAGFKVRYICAGEYGTKKGRAHWHIILFFYGAVPPYELETRMNWPYWPHGFSYFQRPDYKGFRYVMKYALKQDGDASVKSLAMSKKPPLGHDFFMSLAADIVDRRLPIHSPEYAFAHVLDRTGKPRRYWLQGRMREIFLGAYCDLWRAKYGTEPPYTDFLVEKYLDPIARRELDLDPSRYERDRDARDVAYRAKEDAKRRAMRREIGFLNLGNGTNWLVVVYSDQTAELHLKDEKPCHLSASASVGAQLQASGLPKQWQPPVRLYLLEKWGLLPPSRRPVPK